MTAADGAPADPSKAELGERLATWLEGLGLESHLATAGLPTYVRDEQGRARWTDPGTGEPLTRAQLGQLDQLLHGEGSEPEHAVPVSLVLIARHARLRTELLAGPWFSYETLAELRGASVEATRFSVHKAGNERRLLVVPSGDRSIVPAFQIDADGEPRADLAAVLEPLLAAGMDPWRAWAWLTQPAALLGGEVPERAAADPASAGLVALAAARLAERVADRG
ncbi:hypothetical protein [Nocardioides panaciterrulae]|uniref:Uncharacterized protein n=1 Tax=Nocardioides panaciterrulae TaxID=661492 RepID=A0A7Y9E5C3_9ACTN|nr:hypothetical protein [Nocardioides panaciterrulae]NYD41503.1 hypothetical protein [Nocardioides panaciterrulae]